VKFPADKASKVLANAKAMLADEARHLDALRKAGTAAEVRAAFSGRAYAPKKK
jgi:hypothetical protein